MNLGHFETNICPTMRGVITCTSDCSAVGTFKPKNCIHTYENSLILSNPTRPTLSPNGHLVEIQLVRCLLLWIYGTQATWIHPPNIEYHDTSNYINWSTFKNLTSLTTLFCHGMLPVLLFLRVGFRNSYGMTRQKEQQKSKIDKGNCLQPL
jgi:hypothetical protein